MRILLALTALLVTAPALAQDEDELRVTPGLGILGFGRTSYSEHFTGPGNPADVAQPVGGPRIAVSFVLDAMRWQAWLGFEYAQLDPFFQSTAEVSAAWRLVRRESFSVSAGPSFGLVFLSDFRDVAAMTGSFRYSDVLTELGAAGRLDARLDEDWSASVGFSVFALPYGSRTYREGIRPPSAGKAPDLKWGLAGYAAILLEAKLGYWITETVLLGFSGRGHLLWYGHRRPVPYAAGDYTSSAAASSWSGRFVVEKVM